MIGKDACLILGASGLAAGVILSWIVHKSSESAKCTTPRISHKDLDEIQFIADVDLPQTYEETLVQFGMKFGFLPVLIAKERDVNFRYTKGMKINEIPF
jgi:hypothetical protein